MLSRMKLFDIFKRGTPVFPDSKSSPGAESQLRTAEPDDSRPIAIHSKSKFEPGERVLRF
jgi:hypothetical protein